LGCKHIPKCKIIYSEAGICAAEISAFKWFLSKKGIQYLMARVQKLVIDIF
jgi:hypothetical protein